MQLKIHLLNVDNMASNGVMPVKRRSNAPNVNKRKSQNAYTSLDVDN
jgi:hypothetical protein